MKTTNDGMTGTLRCPACFQTPKTTVDQNDMTVTIQCELHGYEARGSSLDQARVHWNQFISFIRKAA